ncbi:MAG: hypothetical protein JXQ73_21685 [Phycisphaerae bacterium]|nr:hypothetical protein [Phycisphaerae bacterium]
MSRSHVTITAGLCMLLLSLQPAPAAFPVAWASCPCRPAAEAPAPRARAASLPQRVAWVRCASAPLSNEPTNSPEAHTRQASRPAAPCGAQPATSRSSTQAGEKPIVRFTAYDVFIDTANQPLAAYQLELAAPPDRLSIVGVEGGQHPAFAAPPYYDPAALTRNRIIIAAFNTAKDLPTGKTRVARVHVRLVGDQDPDVQIKLTVSTGSDGNDIPAKATVVRGGKP